MNELSIRSYAHIGDAVYEVYAREKTILLTQNPKILHKLTVSVVNAEFHAEILELIKDFLTEQETEFIRRARNLAVTTGRRTNQKIHRLSTALEALIGYFYLKDKERLAEFYKHIDDSVTKRLSEKFLVLSELIVIQ